ncbi:MAG: phosphate ABC transporter permease subunit PstC [Gemmatimonadetes bacterium]|nr:phosphate ABC transporter permease subunit PstC [Gemmatimonadota bacterium]
MARAPRRDEEVRRAEEILAPESDDPGGPASEQPAGVLIDPTADAVRAPAVGLPQSPASGIAVLGGSEPATSQTVHPPLDLRTPFGRNLQERAIGGVLFLASVVSVLTTFGIVAVLIVEAAGFFEEVSPVTFLTGTQWAPLFQPQHFGVLPLLVGSLLVTVIAALVALPIGLASAIYLSEYASRGVRRIVKPALEILAGVPTVVYGYFALTFVTPLLQGIWPGMSVFNALSASLVMGIMIIPVVASLSEDALSAVPRSIREGAYALGATKLEVSLRTVVPSALSGIVASFILAISRAIGETMIVTIAAGSTPNLTVNPLESVQTMTAYMVQVSMGEVVFGSVEYRTIFAVGLTLFAITLFMNIMSILILRRFREVYE